MRKYIFSLALVAMFAVTLVSSMVVYAGEEIRVTVDGQRVIFADQTPVIANGRTLVPVRGVFEMLGFEVEWDDNTRTAVITSTDYEIRISIDSYIFTANGEQFTLDVPAQLIGGRTMVPLRLPLESIGMELDWNGANQEIYVWSFDTVTPLRTVEEIGALNPLRPELWGEDRERVLQIINNFRASHNLSALIQDFQMTDQANIFLYFLYGNEPYFVNPPINYAVGYNRSLGNTIYEWIVSNRQLLLGNYTYIGISMRVIDGEFYSIISLR